MTTMERPGPVGDPQLTHDDPLLDGLLILCKLHDCPASRASLTAGLPLPEQRLSAELLPRAAARAGLQGRLLRRELSAISSLNLPVLLLLKNLSSIFSLTLIQSLIMQLALKPLV